MLPALFFKMYSSYAIKTQIIDNVPASITLAQAALESSWGESGLTKQANNFFGIKDQTNDEYKGPNVVKDTTEYFNGVKTTVNSKFRKYSTPQGSFNDHASFLHRNPRYAGLFALNITDYKGWASGLQMAGYATDPLYSSKLIQIIEKYNLSQYDQEAVLKKKCLPPPSL